MNTPTDEKRILLTGATGYVGGRLLRRLERDGHRVRCMVRDPARLVGRVGSRTEVVAGDVLEPASLEQAMADVDTAFYLIHSMGADSGFEQLDRRAAENFAAAAARAGARQIIYLGGLGSDEVRLSRHLRSRQEVGEVLRSGPVPVIEFRASIILGSGSLSYEMIRALVERLPVMITPRWVAVRAQPIAIEDVLSYLQAAIGLSWEGGAIFPIGGADQTSYGGIMREYARQRGLKRLMIPVPLLTPRLSSLWLGLVTPVYARIGRKLVDGLRYPTVVEDDLALRTFSIRPLGLRDAIAHALRQEDEDVAASRWFDALSSAGLPPDWSRTRFGTRITDVHEARSSASPEDAFALLSRLGGTTGWLYADWLWRLRGFLDLLVGGVGVRRGRHHPTRLAVGDAVDWWRIEAVEPGRHLRLRAEMKLPGRAWLDFEIQPLSPQPPDGPSPSEPAGKGPVPGPPSPGSSPSGCRIRQTAIFDPVGLGGRLYWYVLLPIHKLIFSRMLARIASRAGASGK